MPLATDLLIYETGWPLEQDFSSTNETMKVEMIKVLYKLRPLETTSLIVCMVEENAVCHFVSQIPAYLAGCQMQSDMCTFWLVEARKSILSGHKAKFSGHGEKKGKVHLIFI